MSLYDPVETGNPPIKLVMPSHRGIPMRGGLEALVHRTSDICAADFGN